LTVEYVPRACFPSVSHGITAVLHGLSLSLPLCLFSLPHLVRTILRGRHLSLWLLLRHAACELFSGGTIIRSGPSRRGHGLTCPTLFLESLAVVSPRHMFCDLGAGFHLIRSALLHSPFIGICSLQFLYTNSSQSSQSSKRDVSAGSDT